MKKISKIKRFLIIALIFLFSINSFAAIVSDNDGSAFVTKAEFDALKKSFAIQIDDYNKSIDGKIDGAIASYLAGISLAKTESIKIKSPASEVYCMNYRTDTQEKDMKYTYVTPYVNFTAVNWERYVYDESKTDAESTSRGRYVWYIKMIPKPKKTTGTRLYIKNVIDKKSGFNGCAEWMGYGTGVSESQTWSSTDVIYKLGNYGAHNMRSCGFGMQHFDPIKNTQLGNKTWKIGDAIYCPNMYQEGCTHIMEFTSNNNSMYIYVTSIGSEYTKLNNKNMIIWAPETYYCFTEYDNYRDFCFDNESTSVNLKKGTTNKKTYVEELWKKIKTPTNDNYYYDWQTDMNDFKEIFEKIDTSVSATAWWQNNMKTSPDEYYNVKTGTNFKVDMYAMVNPHRKDANEVNTDYGVRTGRQLYTVQGFPWYSINNWNQLYCKGNDWATVDINASECSTIIDTPTGDKHLSLNGGWPIIEVEKDHTYTYKVNFKEACDHIVFGKLTPFTTSNPTTESNLIEWDNKTPTTWDSKKVAYAKSGETLVLSFTAQSKGILYLKWADDDPVTHTPTGGGTIQLDSEILDTYAG